MRLSLLFVLLLAVAGVAAGTAGAGTVCTGDVCVITGGFPGFASRHLYVGRAARRNTASLEQWRSRSGYVPPGPCFVGDLHPPSPCLPDYRYFASAAVLVLVDAQVRVLGGFTAFGCPGGCSFPAAAARLIDGDIQTMLADPSMYPSGLPSLPAIPPGPPGLG